MASQQLLMVFTLATAGLALWAHVRWPRAAPDSIKGAIWRALLAVALLQVGGALLDLGFEALPSLAVLIVVGAVVPILTYAFLASIWFLKVCADQIRGA